jgi:hypothetical protein
MKTEKIDYTDMSFKTRMKRYVIIRSDDGKFKKWKPKIPEMDELKILKREVENK